MDILDYKLTKIAQKHIIIYKISVYSLVLSHKLL